MSQWRLTMLLLSPSWLSFSLISAISLCSIGFSNWSYFTYNQVVFDFFYGKNGLITTLEQVPGAVDIAQFADNPAVYGVAVVVFAAVAAVAVFFVVRGAERGVGAAAHVGQGVDRREYVQHGLLRLLVLMLWVGYGFLSAHILFPAALLFSRIGAEDFFTSMGMAISIGGAFLFWITLHGHVVFARLFRLRPRVFGGEAVIESAIIK
jgi:hypothetical protein